MYRQLILTHFVLGFSNCLNLCGDWTQFKDIKCLKVLEKVGTEEEALHNCTQLDQSSTLLTIHSQEEQELIYDLLLNYRNLSTNAWIGLKYTDKVYKWMDGTDIDFTNLAKDAVLDGTDQCVQISLVPLNFGKWTDESCKKTSLIVCQKKQEFSLNIVRDLIENQQKLIENQQAQLNSMIPLGFIYTQYPNQSTPQQLWPNFAWSEITRNYAGLFFRAEGNGSGAFGQIQQANQSWISEFNSWGSHYLQWDDKSSGVNTSYYGNEVNYNNWTEMIPPDNKVAIDTLRIYTTGGDVRPKNTAIKIWKRIK